MIYFGRLWFRRHALTLLELLSWLICRFRGPRGLELEVIALLHQLAVMRRQRPGRTQLFSIDRLIWVWLYRALWPRFLKVIVVVKPTTVIQWHRRGFRLCWRWRSKSESPQSIAIALMADSCQPALGCAADPWRVAQARHRGQSSTVAKHMMRRRGSLADLAELLAQRSYRHRRDRHVRHAVCDLPASATLTMAELLR